MLKLLQKTRRELGMEEGHHTALSCASALTPPEASVTMNTS